MTHPLCFVLMPFGQKPDAGGALIDFDSVYAELIRPAIEQADLVPLRADEEMSGGIIHKPMFERLVLCDYAIADLTTANANVFYELGVRHAVRPWSTVLLFAEGSRLPFDLAPLRAIPYRLDPGGRPVEAAAAATALAERLRAARAHDKDSPVFQLLDWAPPPNVPHAKTDVFREQVEYSSALKERLAVARQGGLEEVREVHRSIEPISDCEAGIVVDLLLSYRAVKAWDDMIALAAAMPRPLRGTVLVQEQLGFALNRAGRGEEAERVLTTLIERRGPSSETYGILGRVFKDRWEAAERSSDTARARGLLGKAIDAYLRGFEADWRDAYPGINAVTLMELRDPPDPRRRQLLPVVRYAVERRIAGGRPDYWDYATRLELAVFADEEDAAAGALADALAAVRERWEPEATAGNLTLIQAARKRRGEAARAWVDDAIGALRASSF